MDLKNERRVEHNMFSECGGSHISHIEIKGTSYNSSDTSAAYMYWSQVPGNRIKDASSARGLTLIVWEHSSMSEVFREVYDVYAVDSRRSELAAQLGLIHDDKLGNVIYALVSFDAISTNESLGAAMERARANHWFKDGLNGPTYRHSYAAIGTSRLGIIKEVMHGPAVGHDPAFASMAVSADWNEIGAEGYGPDLLGGLHMNEYNYTGTGYSFKSSSHTITDRGRDSILDGEYVKMTGQHKISRDRQLAGGRVTSYFWTASDSDGWISSSSRSSYSTEWESFELYFQWNKARDTASSGNTGGAEAKYLRTGHYHMPSSNDVGTSSVRNMQIQRCGFNPNDTGQVGVDANVLAAKIVSEGIGFKLGSAQSYYDLWASPKNLTNRPSLADSRIGSGFDTEQVRWFDRTLTARNEYSIHEGKNLTSDSNRYNDVGYVNIDSNKMYVGLIWMNCQQKIAGSNYFGTHTRSNGSQVPTYAYTGTSNTTNPYSHYIDHSNIEKDKWSLMAYWFLPHWFTNDQGNDFYIKNWSKTFGNYENGSADNNTKTAGSVAANGGNIRVSRFQEADDQIHLRWLDYYNGTTSHKTWWALPGIYEVDPMGIRSSGHLFPGGIKEV